MNQPLRVLIVEDSDDDVDLLLHALRRGGYEVTSAVVETPAAMRAALARQDWDVITSDHAMPFFSAPAALALAKEVCPDVPFIIVSGEIDLNLAVSLMRGGAQDYISERGTGPAGPGDRTRIARRGGPPRAPTGGGRAAGARSALPVVGRGGKGPGHFHARSGGIHRRVGMPGPSA